MTDNAIFTDNDLDLLRAFIAALYHANADERHASQDSAAYGHAHEGIKVALATITESASVTEWVIGDWCITGEEGADLDHLVERTRTCIAHGLHAPEQTVRNHLRAEYGRDRGLLADDRNDEAVDAYIHARANAVYEHFGQRHDFSVVYDAVREHVTTI